MPKRFICPEFRVPILIALGCALLLRALVPVGWMPTRTAQGLVLELCSGQAPGGDLRQARAARELLGAALAGASQKPGGERHDGTPRDQTCAFAGLGASWTAPAAPEPPALLQAPADIQPPALAAAVGRGLSAPPPPSTGPPLLS